MFVSVLEPVVYNLNPFFMHVVEGGEHRDYLPSSAPPLYQSIFTQTHEATQIFTERQGSREQSLFQPLYSWEKAYGS